MSKGRWLVCVVITVLMAACKPGTPAQYIQPDDMEDILVEYHLAKALALSNDVPYNERDIKQSMYIESVFQKHGVTKADFDSSLVYYYSHAERFQDVYKKVAERLEDQAMMLGASEGEVGKYAMLDATGDTANIWADRSVMALMPLPPYNRWDFVLEGDTTCRRGDTFLLQFTSDFMYQAGQKGAVVYLAIEYGDTVIAYHRRFSSSGLTQMQMAGNDKQEIKRIKGYFFVERGDEPPTTLRLLFINNVQLIRFHKEIKDNEENKTDSIQPDSIGRRLDTDSVGGRDTTRHRHLMLQLDTGATPNRMDARERVRQTR